jgi:hypothetical protein
MEFFMPKPRSARRIFFLAIALLLLVYAGQRYLASAHAREQLEARLQLLYGGPLRCAGTDIGLSASSIHDLQLFEADDNYCLTPWARIPEVRAQISLWNLIGGGDLPEQIELTDVEISLRFDREGRLLTRLRGQELQPATVPSVHITQGTLTIRQEGRADLVVGIHDVTLRPRDTALELSGEAGNQDWGQWILSGRVEPNGRDGLVAVHSRAPVHVTQSMLRALPFIDPMVWRAVDIEGDSEIEFSLQSRPEDKDAHYRVIAEPRATRVYVAPIGLLGVDASGKVHIEDGLVLLRDVKGTVAGGQIDMSADLDFRMPPDRLSFDLKASRLQLGALPPRWEVPPLVDGLAGGAARLVVNIHPDKVSTAGQGSGTVTNARLLGTPVGSFPIVLTAAGGVFQFQVRRPR